MRAKINGLIGFYYSESIRGIRLKEATVNNPIKPFTKKSGCLNCGKIGLFD